MNINWHPLVKLADIQQIVDRSFEVPCMIFKHSTRCGISSLAKNRLEARWDFGEEELEVYYLDLIQYREISSQVAESFSVYHESPQILLIYQGECFYDSSHLDISVDDIREAYQPEMAKYTS